jgi:glycosyltransferase 2 family protein
MRIRAAVVVLLVVVIVVCLGWVLRGMDPHALEQALASFQPAWLGPVVALYVGVLLLRTWRFQSVLDAEVRYRGLLSVVTVGQLAIGVVPLRMGEIVRPYLLWEKWRVPIAAGAAAVVLERLLDFVALLTLLLVVGAKVALPPGGLTVGNVDLLAAGQHVATVAVGAGLLGIVVTIVVGPPGLAVMERVVGRVSPLLAARLGRLGRDLVSALRGLAKRPSRAAVALGCTAGIWAGTMLGAACLMNAFPALGATLDRVLVNWAGTMTALVLGPTPGFLGTFEAGSVGSLALLGVQADLALAYTAVMHTSLFLFTVATGLVFLALEGWSLVAVVRRSRRAGAGETA